MSKKKTRRGGWHRPWWAPPGGPVYHVVLDIGGVPREFDLDARVHGWLCFECGELDTGEGHTAPCGHERGYCTERVLNAWRLQGEADQVLV
jgi:hypothetical protein